ncbi:MAG: hypothetical protein ACRDGT_09100, partial [Candidatus Limnocylindria bacterium]
MVTDLADRGIALAEIALEARDGIQPAGSELVPGQAVVQAIHQLRWAWALLFAGGEVPAKALGRLVCEFVLLFWYATLLPERTSGWLDPALPVPKFARIWSKVGARAVAEDPELVLLPVLYTHLSRASHFDPLVFAFSFRWRNDAPEFFPAEAPLDRIGIHRAAEMLLPLTSLALGALARWMETDSSNWWQREEVAYREEVANWNALEDEPA